MATVGVVVPCRNEARWLHQVLDGLERQDRAPDDVVVVDDGSADDTANILEAYQRRHRLPLRIVPGPRRGVAAAVNTGVAALATDIVVRLDDHCRPAADYISLAVSLIETPGVGVAGGVWTIEPGASTTEAAAIAIAAAHQVGSGGALYRTGATTTLTDVETVPFGCFRRALWESLSGLDERLLANEDYEFHHRVRRRGRRVVLNPAMHCTYFARPTMKALARQYLWYGWWKARMLARYPTAVRLRQVIPALLVPVLALRLAAAAGGGGVWWSLIAVYPLAMAVAALHAARTSRRWAAVGWIAAAFLTMHMAWSAAFFASLVSLAFPAREASA